jgi:hypothetical protein
MQDASLTSYSNFGPRIDVSAPGGDLPLSGLIISTSNDGTTIPGQPDYEAAAGTSFAAPLVSGTAALMLARNPMLTGGRILGLGPVRRANFRSARSAPGSPSAVRVFRCRRGACQHVAWRQHAAARRSKSSSITTPTSTITSSRRNPPRSPISIACCRAVPADRAVFLRLPVAGFRAIQLATGMQIFAAGLINSHFFSASASNARSCSRSGRDLVPETASSFYIQVPDFNGNCPADTLPVYRFLQQP